jgi:integrase
MGTITKRRDKIQVRITHRLLVRPLYRTFDAREEAEQFCRQVEDSLRAGVVPPAIHKLLEDKIRRSELDTLADAIDDYQRSVALAAHDVDTLGVLKKRYGSVRISDVSRDWCLALLREMKVVTRLTPETIRKQVGSFRRLFAWLNTDRPHVTTANAFDSLPRGYSAINSDEARLIERSGSDVQSNAERDRRLEKGEEQKIRHVLEGHARGDRERSPMLNDRTELGLLLDLALETAMRMREIYTLTEDQVNLEKATIFLDRTKNGDSRQVPLSTVAVAALRSFGASRGLRFQDARRTTRKAGGRNLFSFMPRGPADRQALQLLTSRISQRFQWLFRYAGLEDFRFHDLRHEAICRFYERTTLTDVQIARITGHKDPRMLKRYASLRGSDLAPKLW